jgi:DNA-binding MarR family transcriptional regulator
MMSDALSSAERTQPFTMVFNAVIDQYQLNPFELALYVAIARHVNRGSGVAFPTYTRLQEVTGQARATVSKYLQSLERKRLIHITRRFRAGTKARAVNHYRLLDPADRQLTLEEAVQPGSSRCEPQVVHEADNHGSRPEPQVVHGADGNKIESNKTKPNHTDSNQRGPARRAGSAKQPATYAQNSSAPESSAAPQVKADSSEHKETWNRFCHALADLCQLDFEANQGKIRRFASHLWQHGQGYTSADLKVFEAWWYAKDWRGKKGDIPRLDEVAQTIRVAVEAEQRELQKAVDDRYRYISGELAAYIQY